ncbi:hypothetical protein RhoFasGS6_02641 [Rhodococcus fascians]|uniref:glycosyltransferase n=1 Tax=Rhodococcoides fascians TaxID=1828 RepID=UPI001427AE3A|nr:hypothetical protein [Rhodococcus fascians]
MTPSVAIIGTRGYPSYYGGFETLVRHLAPYLADSGWDVTVYSRPGAVSTHDDEADPRIRSIVTRGFETKSLSTLSYGAASCIDAALKKPDVALVMNVANGYWLPMLKARGIPTAINVDGIEWERQKWGSNAKRVFLAGAKLTAKLGTELIIDAKALEVRWQQDFGRRGTFIPYGGTVPGDLDVPDGLRRRSYVLMVARFVPENSFDEFIGAAEILCKDTSVVIVGSSGYGGALDAQVKKLAEQNANVSWLGHVSDDRLLFALWQNAGAYFHGHSVGGTNPALVQAMACGAPIVARDTVYNREVLGPQALVVEPNSIAIAAKIRDLLSDSKLQESQSAAASKRAMDTYSWAGVCEAYESVLSKLASNRPNPTGLKRYSTRASGLRKPGEVLE